jgi:hypothetical protein
MFLLRPALLTFLSMFLLLLSARAEAQEGGIRAREEPVALEQMGEFKDIRFKQENFEKVVEGMTEKEVLSLLGKPLDMKKEQRKGHRWSFHYYYPEGCVVNFRNGLVVGKEKQ